MALAALASAGCARADDSGARERLLRRATRHVEATLHDALDRARRALDGVPAAVAGEGLDRAMRFERIEALRDRVDVDGLSWEMPGGDFVWAGSPVDLTEDPDAEPWSGSFRRGDVTWHAGPFLRAIVATRPSAGGIVTATVVLADPRAAPVEGRVEETWAAREGVRAVRVVDPASPAPPPSPSTARVGIRGTGDAADVLRLEIDAPGDDALADRARAAARRDAGYAWIAGFLAAGAFLAGLGRRRLGTPGLRALWVGALALGARTALAALDLPGRFRALAPAFRPMDFALPGWFGWLESPGDFFLTSTALLVAGWGASRRLGETRPPRGGVGGLAVVVAGAAIATASTLGWLVLVEAAANHAGSDYFTPGSLFPDLPRSLMLTGLAAATAASWLLARAGLLLAAAGAPRAPLGVARTAAGIAAGAAAGAAALALAPSSTHAWTAFLVPVAAGALAPAAAREEESGAPSRIVLVSVVATAILFPVLWVGVRDASRGGVAAEVIDLVSREDRSAQMLRVDLEPFVRHRYLADALAGVAAEKPPPEGLAMTVWRGLPLLAHGGERGAVTVLRAQGPAVDRFALDAPPFSRLPPATRIEGPADVVVETVEAPASGFVRCVVGRVRVRDAAGRDVGTVVVEVPDALALAIEGLSRRVALGDSRTEERFPLRSLALVRGGRVVASNDPNVPHASAPVAAWPTEPLAGPTWLAARDGEPGEWLAVPAGSRGTVLASFEAGDPGSVLAALARLVILAVGVGGVVALVALLAGRETYRPRLRGKILGSYFAISVLPVVVLGWVNWRDALARGMAEFEARQETIVRGARRDLETLKDEVVEQKPALDRWAAEKGYDVTIYRHGTIHASSVEGLVEAEILPTRLPAHAYRAVEIEGRDFFARTEGQSPRRIHVGYAPVRDERGEPLVAIAVPMRYDAAQAEREAAQTGSVLLAAYLLTLVLIVVIGIYTARGIARPLDQLAGAVQRVAAGELDVTLPGEGTDEIGRLVAAFNKMTSDLRVARARAAEAEREAAWRGMARQVAHEIKNPLTPMKLMLQQLLATATSDPAYAARSAAPTARIVLEQIDALARIASDFSAFARFPPRHLEEVDVEDVLRSVVALYSAAAAGGGDAPQAVVATEAAEGLPRVRWDRDELRRVFVNLVANAVEAVDPAKGVVHVAVRSRAARHGASNLPGVLVTVEDDGVGIPEASRDRLFQPDFSTKSSGTGLGLAIVKRILSDLGGEIAIESTPGRGTKASVWLPASPPPP